MPWALVVRTVTRPSSSSLVIVATATSLFPMSLNFFLSFSAVTWSFLPGRRRAYPLGFALSLLHSRRLHRCLPNSRLHLPLPNRLGFARTGTWCGSCMCGRSWSQLLRHLRARLWFAGPLLCHEWRTTLSGTLSRARIAPCTYSASLQWIQINKNGAGSLERTRTLFCCMVVMREEPNAYKNGWHYSRKSLGSFISAV